MTQVREQPLAIRLADVLSVRYPQDHAWSPSGSHIAFLEDDLESCALCVGRPAEAGYRRLTADNEWVSEFVWHPTSDSITYVSGDRVLMVWATEGDRFGSPRQLLAGSGKPTRLRWSPDGTALYFVLAGRLQRWSETGGVETLRHPGTIAGHEGPFFDVSPNGRQIAFSFIDQGGLQLGILGPEGLAWRTFGSTPARQPCWLSDDRLFFIREIDSYRRREHVFLSGIVEGRYRETMAFAEEDERGLLHPRVAQLSPNGDSLCLMLREDGWDHLYLLSTSEPHELRQITFGECEDSGHRHDHPQWSPDGHSIVFSSNREVEAGERELHLLHLPTGQLRRLTRGGGNHVEAAWSPDGAFLAFLHSDRWGAAELCTLALQSGDEAAHLALTSSTPAAFDRDGIAEPEAVTIRSDDGLTIYGYLLRPKDLDPRQPHPAIVWLHGGPSQQMRKGWHPSQGYSLMYSHHQYLVQRGYVILHLNYRGSLGHGKAFEQAAFRSSGISDCADVAAAGRYLRDLPYVHPEQLTVWGHSYGGYMALNVMTKHPGLFALGINSAGIWDIDQWIRWKERHYFDARGNAKRRIGGEPDLAKDAYRAASPRWFVHQLRDRIVSFHGMADTNVDFGQVTQLIEDCLRHGKDHDAHVYPGEVHTFRNKSSWQHYLRHAEAELERLRDPGWKRTAQPEPGDGARPEPGAA